MTQMIRINSDLLIAAYKADLSAYWNQYQCHISIELNFATWLLIIMHIVLINDGEYNI